MNVKKVKDFLNSLPDGCDDLEIVFKGDCDFVCVAEKIAPCKVVSIQHNPRAYKKSSHPKGKMVLLIS